MNIVKNNGFIVMEALHALSKPVPLQIVINKIAEIYNVNPGGITETVKIVLQTDVDNGFLARQDGRYTIAGEHVSVNESNSRPEGVAVFCGPMNKKRRKSCPPKRDGDWNNENKDAVEDNDNDNEDTCSTRKKKKRSFRSKRKSSSTSCCSKPKRRKRKASRSKPCCLPPPSSPPCAED